MARVEKTIFICYRRTNAFHALAIFKELTHRGYDVFIDFQGIPSGDFATVITENIQGRAHFLILLTPSALERCSEPRDWLRREIELALECGRNIVPIMLEGFSFTSPGIAPQLTGTLAALPKLQALGMPVEYFDAAVDKLCDRYLNVSVSAVLQPVSPAVSDASRREQDAAVAAPLVQESALTAEGLFERALDATDPREAARLYTEAILLRPEYFKAYVNRGVARVHLGDQGGAREDFDQALKLDPHSAHALMSRGTLLSKLGDLIAARRDLDAAVERDPTLFAAYFNRAGTRLDGGDLAGALADYDIALRLEPSAPGALTNRALARGMLGDTTGALQDLDAALSVQQDDATIFFNRAVLRAMQYDERGARADYDAAIALDPALADPLMNRVQVKQLWRQDPGAPAKTETIGYAQPKIGLMARAFVRQALGLLEDSLADLEALLTEDPANTTALTLRASIHIKRGHFSSAVEDLKRVIAVAPSNTTATDAQELLDYLFHSENSKSLVRLRLSLEVRKLSPAEEAPEPEAMNPGGTEVVTRFASALDREDYAVLPVLLADECEYATRNGLARGPADIIDSYRTAGERARRLVDRIRYESTVRREADGDFIVTFIDDLEIGGARHTYTCEQIVTVDPQGCIRRIMHRELPGQRQALAAFLDAHSVDKKSAPTIGLPD